MAEPLAIRMNNPGAMWGGKHARKWGATANIAIGDIQGNMIARFPDMRHGAAAQFDLWRVAYTGMTLSAAVKKWSGGNSSLAYVKFLEDRTGINRNEKITKALLMSPRGLALMQAQAHWEAGKPYPMTEAEWRKAQAMVFAPTPSKKQPRAPMPAPTPNMERNIATVSAGAIAAILAAMQNNWKSALAIAVGGLVVAAFFYIFWNRRK